MKGIPEETRRTLAVGRVAEAIDPSSPFESLGAVLEVLRESVEADACEIFLAEGGRRGELVQVSCAGRDRDALETIPRFARGSGFPGRVVSTARPIATNRLDKERGFLREEAKKRGIRSFVGVPLADFGSGPIGALNLAWRRADIPKARMLAIASKAALPISAALVASLAGMAESLGAAAKEFRDTDPRRWLTKLLRQIQRQSGATGAGLICVDPRTRKSLGTTMVGVGTYTRDCARREEWRSCSHLHARRGVALTRESRDVPSPCAKRLARGEMACCAPLFPGAGSLDRIALDFGHAAKGGMGSRLLPVRALASEAARILQERFPSLISDSAAAASSEPGRDARPAALEIRCLGRFEVLRNGRVVPREKFTRRKALTLLKLLVVRAGKGVTRDALIDAFWPDADAESGANRLYGVVHSLRAAIEPQFRERKWAHVRASGEQYYFNPDAGASVDLLRFLTLLRETGSAPEGDRALLLVQEAVDLYVGDLFGDERDDDLFESDRESLRRLYLGAVDRLVRLRFARGEVEKAVEPLYAALRLDPLNEALLQHLLRALGKLGRGKEAREQFERHVSLIRSELDAEPQPETLKLGGVSSSEPVSFL